MLKSILSFLFVITALITHAQQPDYKSLLSQFYHHSASGFKEIIGEQTDTESIFYPSKLTPDVGEAKIGKYPNAVTFNWTIPLAQSEKVRAAVQDFMKATYSNATLYKTVSDGTEDEGDMTTNVYALGTAKPLLIFQTMYYKNSEDPDKSRFVMIMYGK